MKENLHANVAEMADAARARSGVYGLLAAVFREEPGEDFLRQLKEPSLLAALSDAYPGFGSEWADRPVDKLADELAIEYTRLFIGPGRHISPHESVHAEGSGGRLWGASTAEAKRLIESVGFEFMPDYGGLPDHISVELEFMQAVSEYEAQAWADGETERAAECLWVRQSFFEAHLAPWVPRFCVRITSETESPFYRDMAKLTEAFLALENEELRRRADRPAGDSPPEAGRMAI